MKLILDFGNTLQKAAIFDKNQLIAIKAFKKISLKNISDFTSLYNIDSAIISSVINYNSDIYNYLNTNYYFKELTSDTPIPVKNTYLTPDTLGKDRLAAVVAANDLYPKSDILVINAGTCITYDFIDKNKKYHGGAISPGITMKFKALHTFTDKLPLIENTKKLTPLIGNDTEKSILSGVINGTIAEIKNIISDYNQKYSHLNVVISGGDMKYFDKIIKNSIFAYPNIVLYGLNLILDFNAKKEF